MTHTTPEHAVVSSSRILRFNAGVIALIELSFSVPGLPLLADPSALTVQGLPGWMILANILATPLLALAALLFAIISQLRNAIFALGALVLAGWVNTAVAAFSYGFNFEDAAALDNVMTIFQTFIAPVIATSAIVLAAMKRKIAWAVLLVSLSTLVNVMSIAVIATLMAGRGG